MFKKTSNIELMYKSVQRFQDLGTGRERKRVVVGDSDDARTSTFSFAGKIHHNWPSLNEVRIKIKDGVIKFDTVAQTVRGKAAYIFPWNELTADLYYRQCEAQKLLEWADSAATAAPGDFIAIVELIVEEAKSDYRVWTYPSTERVNLPRIEIELGKLDLRTLLELNSLIAFDPPPVVVLSRKAA
jgi:hypothetical protein